MFRHNLYSIFNLRVKILQSMILTPLYNYIHKDSSILELGCGTGVLSFLFKQYDSLLNITAIDIDKDSIEYANNVNKLLNFDINFISEDFYNYFGDDVKFDHVVSLSVIDFCCIDDFIKLNHKLLKNNGHILILNVDNTNFKINRTLDELKLYNLILKNSKYYEYYKDFSRKNTEDIFKILEKYDFYNIKKIKLNRHKATKNLDFICANLEYIKQLWDFELHKLNYITNTNNYEKVNYIGNELKDIINKKYANIMKDYINGDLNLDYCCGNLYVIVAQKNKKEKG